MPYRETRESRTHEETTAKGAGDDRDKKNTARKFLGLNLPANWQKFTLLRRIHPSSVFGAS
jgi:hypothetical protein